MAAKKKSVTRKTRKKKTAKRFRFQLDYAGIAGIAIVMFCLFLWMFLLGIWAGQTILLPSPPADTIKGSQQKNRAKAPVTIIRPNGRKTPVAHKQ
jgi:hypothetical protein